jgi:hypothetical protein
MRIATASLMLVVLTAVANAEQADSRPKPSSPTLPPQKLIIRSEDLFPLTRPTHLGMFTLVPPQTNGEVIRLSIPVGELATRAARSISDARRRRAERKVEERIERELDEKLKRR